MLPATLIGVGVETAAGTLGIVANNYNNDYFCDYEKTLFELTFSGTGVESVSSTVIAT